MFSSSVCAALSALVFAAVTVSAAPRLSLSLSGPQSVSSVSALQVVATLANTGDVELKLLNDPRTVLHTFETDTFAITNAEGNSPSFTGMIVKYVPEKVLERNLSSSFTVLAPGESIEITHDLSTAYNFTASGEATYDIAASNKLQYVDPATNSLVTIFADAADAAHTASISGEPAIARRSAFDKRISYQSCTSSQQTQLVSAAAAAQSYANAAMTYLTTNTASTTRWVTWFGNYTAAHHTTMLSHFTKMAASTYANYTYDCSCMEADVFAYVIANTYRVVHLCSMFWQVATTGTNSKGGTLVHESSHFTATAGTSDHAYGQTAAKALAKSNSAKAIANADSHEYFAENNPAQS
ncbi:peptidyl-Lys metalloendopeptidase [Mycena latifolia]|nr:peptidyl-Lys metalloendopeptidase [Mycena latifolia]